MGEPVELANVIGIINSRSSDTEYEIPDHEKMTKHEYMKIDTVRNDMSRPTEAKAEETETDKKVASVEKTLAEQTTLLRRLKWICALLTVSIVIISATFGVLIHVMMKRINDTENTSGLPPADLQLDRERLARLESDRTEDRSSMQSQESRLTQLEQSLIYQNVELQTHNSRIAVLLESNKSSDQGVLNHTARLIQLEANMDELNSTLTRFKEYKSGFTYYSPQDGPRNGTIRFIGKKSNIGGHYDSSTGQFNCPYSGIYVFFLHIRDRGVSPSSLTRCWIRKNGSINLYNYLSRIDYGRYESSTSLVLHLSQGDIVDLGECSIADTFGGWSTFSGFLLQAD